jgi:putative ABC transport system permease protein
MTFYRLLLHLLPRDRRDRYGADMAAVFADQRRAARKSGILRVTVLWMKEVGGLTRFSLRERLSRARSGKRSSSRFDAPNELRWAWRGIRARRWRALLIVSLLAVALAANALVFAVADSLVFHRLLYADADRIVEIQQIDQRGGNDRFFSADLLDRWRDQKDLFSSVQGYLTKTLFLPAEGAEQIETVPTVDLTPGVTDLLGVRPRWGRPLVDADMREQGSYPALISESLARRRFGSPDRAPGQLLRTTSVPLLVVGVMPATFRFPAATYQIWRVLDPRGPLAKGFAGVQSIARIAPGVTMDALTRGMTDRSRVVGQVSRRPETYGAGPGAFYAAAASSDMRSMFVLLLGAAFCLLLTACANVANLELTATMQRARANAIQRALGASSALLSRIALLEGAGLIAASLALALGSLWLIVPVISTYLPARLVSYSVNPIDLDGRAVVFTALAAIVTWLFVSWPIVLSASRTSFAGLLKLEDRGSAQSRGGTRIRRLLTIVEVALAVLLVVGGGLCVRSYVRLLTSDRGFDSTNMAQLSYTIPPQFYAGYGERRAFGDSVLERLRQLPGVVAATSASAPPSVGNSPTIGIKLEVDGRPPADEPIALGASPVDPDYFAVVGLTATRGRIFRVDDDPAGVVVTEPFAKRFWPDGDAVGHTFRENVRADWLRVVGVVPEFRGDPRRTRIIGDQPAYFYYVQRPPLPPPPATPPPTRVDNGGSYGFLNVTVRLDSPDRASSLLSIARGIDPRLQVTLDMVDDTYAKQYGDVLLTSRVVSAFGVIAFVVAVVGVYGVMAFLVAGRTREIGIRLALGAAHADISRLIVGSSLKLVIAGAALGLTAAAISSRWVSAQLFGVTGTDPFTYAAVALVVIAAALLATWQPARQAARVDPAITLKAE